MAVDRDGNIIDPFNLSIDTDPKILRDAFRKTRNATYAT
jgi:hypothetical protein